MNLKPIPSRPGYLAGDDGHIYSTRNRWGVIEPRRLTETPTHDGYLRVRIVAQRGSQVRKSAVAVLVAEAFHGPRPFPAAQVRHLDGVRTNNCPGNLAYGTAAENASDRDRHGRTRRGMANNKVRHTPEQVREAVRRVEAGETKAAVARDLNASPSAVARWVRREVRPDAHPIAQWRGVAKEAAA